ncbi:MFS transporter [Thermodesulforhabdus norvegica]|uniref:Sugar phosphate permease n=1 Tax=Thermodesulforhabdus norvegica TaxID=39841 RepID=A0A1I4SL97_9BACT|nr:MFS transporter [Thermodesulforhabdus norvegica]SFM65161.1 Sugar phosphate permease [Thermodesulforhabdus norvegica]
MKAEESLSVDIRSTAFYRWYVFSALALAYFFVYFHRVSFSVVADRLVSEFQTSAQTIGLLGSVYFYCYALMQFPSGLLSDSVGPRKAVTFFTCVAALGSIVFAYAPNLTIAFVGRFLVGLGAAVVFIPTMKILSKWFHPLEFASASGLLNAVGGLGILGATWILAFLTATVGWRPTFKIIGITTLVIAALVWLVVRDSPEDKVRRSCNGSLSGNPGGANATYSLREASKKVFSSRQFWIFATWAFFNYGIFFGFGALWSGPYLMDTYGMDRQKAGMILSLIAWGMIFGSPILGLLSDRILKSRKIPLILCAMIVTLELLLLYLYPSGLSLPLLILFFLLFSVGSSSVVVIAFTALKELFPIETAGTALGALNLFPFLGGAIAMPLLGRVLDLYGRNPAKGLGYPVEAYKTLFLLLVVASAVVLICTIFMAETHEARRS